MYDWQELQTARRVVPQHAPVRHADTARKPLNSHEAHAIASTMPKLKHLEMAYHLISTSGVLQILLNCPKLEFLDQRGCWGVTLDSMVLKQKFPKLKVLGPFVLDTYDNNISYKTLWQ